MRVQPCREQIAWILENCPIGSEARRELEAAKELCELHPAMSGCSTRALRPLIRENDPEIRGSAIYHVENLLSRETPTGGKYTKTLTEKQVREIVQKERERAPVAVFNQTNENIEWARWSWNPVTGCKHGCEYCYARDIANRFYKEKFEPTFRPERLSAPVNTKVPESAKTDIGFKNVFVCSMADLFGEWVPREWIDAVLTSVRENPQWNFLFLTKNPKRYLEFSFPENSWIGTTVDCQERVKPAVNAFYKLNKQRRDFETDDTREFASVFFLSCEPFLTPLSFPDLSCWDWLIIGGCSESSGMRAEQPAWEWVEGLMRQARDSNDGYGIPIYFKPNLTSRPREYPDGVYDAS